MLEGTYGLLMNRKYKIIFVLLLSISNCIVLTNQLAYSRGGGGARGDYRDQDYRNDNFARGDFSARDADKGVRPNINNPDRDANAASTRNYTWDGARSPMAAENLDRANFGHVTAPMSPAYMTDKANLVRENYAYAGLYNKSFWDAHPGAGWDYARGWGSAWAWGYTGWPALASWWGMSADILPTPYDYGNNITYQNDNVYYGTQPLETAAAYYTQAQSLASSVPITTGEASTKSNWKPLGVFSMVQGSQSNTTSMFQLAVNKSGAIKGSYYNPLTDETKALHGAVDKKNMRASWVVGEDKNVVYDTGLNNLMQAQSQMLVHYGKDKTQQWTLVRLKQSKTS